MLNYTLMSIQASELCKQATDAAGVLATRRLQFSDNSDRPRGFCDVDHVIFTATWAQMSLCQCVELLDAE